MYVYLVEVKREGIAEEVVAFATPRLAYRFINDIIPVRPECKRTGRGVKEATLYTTSLNRTCVTLSKLLVRNDTNVIYDVVNNI